MVEYLRIAFGKRKFDKWKENSLKKYIKNRNAARHDDLKFTYDGKTDKKQQ